MKITNIVFAAVLLTGCIYDNPLVYNVDVPSEEGTDVVVPPPVIAVSPEVPVDIPVVVVLPAEEVYLYPAPVDVGPAGGDGSSYTADAGYNGPGNSENTPRCDVGNGKKTGLYKHGMCP